MCCTDSATEVAFEVFEQRPTIALRNDFPNQSIKLRNDRLGQNLAKATPFKTGTFGKLKWHLYHRFSSNVLLYIGIKAHTRNISRIRHHPTCRTENKKPQSFLEEMGSCQPVHIPSHGYRDETFNCSAISEASYHHFRLKTSTQVQFIYLLPTGSTDQSDGIKGPVPFT
jgi:hypothetical protein